MDRLVSANARLRAYPFIGCCEESLAVCFCKSGTVFVKTFLCCYHVGSTYILLAFFVLCCRNKFNVGSLVQLKKLLRNAFVYVT